MGGEALPLSHPSFRKLFLSSLSLRFIEELGDRDILALIPSHSFLLFFVFYFCRRCCRRVSSKYRFQGVGDLLLRQSPLSFLHFFGLSLAGFLSLRD